MYLADLKCDSRTLLYLPFMTFVLFGTLSCQSAPRAGDALVRTGDEISVCGYLFHTGARVVLWNDPGGYDAYRPHRRFDPEIKGPRDNPDRIARYGSFRRGIPEAIAERVQQAGWTLQDLRKVVDRVVVHFDACGTSERCFEVLHDIRGLSAHFMIDVDGTIYQTLDVKERAWHAGAFNDRSIGIEIANIGAYPDRKILDEWYLPDGDGLRLNPEKIGTDFLSTFDPRPATGFFHGGTLNGSTVEQGDFTEAQYRALEKLLITLCRVLPNIPPTVPRAGGEVPTDVIDMANGAPGSEAGIVGHHHISKQKIDPGPAFNWDRIEAALKRVGD